MIWISWLATYLSDPWVLGFWAVISLVFASTCWPQKDVRIPLSKERKQMEVARERNRIQY